MARPPIQALEAIFAVLPATRAEIKNRTGFSKSVIARNIRELHEAGWIHINGWRRGRGHFQAFYKAGKGKDKECTLVAETPAVSQAKWREKAKKEGIYEERAARMRARYWTEKAKRKPNTWLSALMS